MSKDTKSALIPIINQEDQFSFNQLDIYPYKTLNLGVLFLTSHHLIDELLISLWATILFNKQSFFWLEENPLFIQKNPRILANLCADVVLFLVSQSIDLVEIVR
jgi:hypothetical protein